MHGSDRHDTDVVRPSQAMLNVMVVGDVKSNYRPVVRFMLATVWAALSQFMTWWRDELTGLLPGFLSARDKAAIPRRILSLETDGVRLVEMRNGAGQPSATEPAEPMPLAEVLRQLGRDAAKRGASPEIGVRLPYQACFTRRVELPRTASRDFTRLLTLDLERVTPFKPKDVLTAFYPDGVQESPTKMAFRQLVVKRSAVEGPMETMRAAGFDVVRLDCWTEDGKAAVPVNFLVDGAAPSSNGSRMVPMALAAAAAGLLSAAGWLAVDRHETALADIQAREASLKTKVQARREAEARLQASVAEVDAFKRLRATTPSKVAALEELSRLLPDTAWVTDLKIEGNTIDVSGLATQAVQLVPILERSAFFRDASLTSPLTFDQREDKERFSIRVRFRTTLPTDSTETGQ